MISDLDKLTTSVQTLTADIASLKQNTNGIPKIESDMQGIQSSITTLTIDTAANTINIKENQDRITTLEQENVNLKFELENLRSQTRRNTNLDSATLEDQIEMQIKRQQDRYSLIFEGMMENKEENLKLLIKQVGHDAGLNVAENEIAEIYRMGKFNPHDKRPRPIKVTFTTKGTRNQIYANRFLIKNKTLHVKMFG